MTIADPEAAALLRAVLLSPEDDLPRLVYADWLEEHDGDEPCRQCLAGLTRDRGSCAPTSWRECHHCNAAGLAPNGYTERAEFIRSQCRLSGPWGCPGCLPPETRDHSQKYGYRYCFEGCPDCDAHSRLFGRVQQLLDRHWVEWCQPCPVPSVRETAESLALYAPPTFTRGFVSRIELPLAAFMEHAAGLYAAHPITEVRLTDCRIERPNGPYVWFTNIGMDRLPGPPADTNWLPWSIARHLVFDGPAQYYPGFVRHERGYATNGAANAALSTACVTFGRSLAGLAAAAA